MAKLAKSMEIAIGDECLAQLPASLSGKGNYAQAETGL